MMFTLELTVDEASALEQVVNAASIRGKDARLIGAIQNKIDAAADAYQKAQTAAAEEKPADLREVES